MANVDVEGSMQGSGTLGVSNVAFRAPGSYEGVVRAIGPLTFETQLPRATLQVGAPATRAVGVVGPLSTLALNGAPRGTVPVIEVGPGTLDAASLRLDDRGVLRMVPARDLLRVTGPVEIPNGSLELARSVPADGAVLVAQSGAAPVQGTFAGLPEGAVFEVAGSRVRISYVGGDGNDIVVRPAGEEPAPPPVPPAPPAPPVSPAPPVLPPMTPFDPLTCDARRVVLTEVFRAAGRRVRLSGAVSRSLVGRVVQLRSTEGLRSRVRTGPDGTFSLLVRAPRRGSVRYTAAVGGESSRALKLDRGLQVLSRRLAADEVVIRARILRRLARRARVVVTRDTSCREREEVAVLRPDRRGRVTVRLPRLGVGEGLAAYRLATRVGSGRPRTFSLPILAPPRTG